jgi:hypothetical protein
MQSEWRESCAHGSPLGRDQRSEMLVTQHESPNRYRILDHNRWRLRGLNLDGHPMTNERFIDLASEFQRTNVVPHTVNAGLAIQEFAAWLDRRAAEPTGDGEFKQLWQQLADDLNAKPCEYPCLRDDMADWLRDKGKESALNRPASHE